MKIAAVQHDIVWEEPEANVARLGEKVKEAVNQGAQLVALTEMFSWGFSMETDRVNEPVGGLSTRFLVDQAAATGVWVCGSVPELPEGQDKPFNQLVLAGPNGELHTYAKMYPFTYGGEHKNYAQGDAPLQLEIGDLRVSFFICYDLRFGDEFWRLAPDTDLYVIVANWPASRREHWRTLLHARAIENQAWVMGVNRVGDGGGLTYAGDSTIIDPFGEIIEHAEHDEALLLADATAARVEEVRGRYPFLADRKS